LSAGSGHLLVVLFAAVAETAFFTPSWGRAT
jgi:hypothetical protein